MDGRNKKEVMLSRDTDEVIQIYIVDKESTVTRRVKELKGFKKVFVNAHSTTFTSLHLTKDAFKIWNDKMEFVIEKGNVDILVAKDSNNYQIKTLEII